MQQTPVSPRFHHVSFGLGSGDDFLLTAKFFAEVFGGSETRREIGTLGDGLIFHQFSGEKPQTQINYDGKLEPISTPHIAFAVNTVKELAELFALMVKFCDENKNKEWKIKWQSDDKHKVILAFEFLPFDIELLVSEN